MTQETAVAIPGILSTVAVPEALSKEIKDLAWKAKEYQIIEVEDLEGAVQLSRRVVALSKEIDGIFKEPIAEYNRRHKELTAFLRDTKKPLEEASGAIDSRILGYRREEEQRRLAEEAKLRQKAIEEAEKARKAAAAALKKEGRIEEAKAVAKTPVVVPVVRIEAPKMEGAHVRENWKARVSDFKALAVFAVTQGRFELIEPNQKTLDALAKASKNSLEIPGVVPFNEETLVRM